VAISDSTVAIIGTGNIGSRLAANFAAGGLDFLLAGRDQDAAGKVASGLGGHANSIPAEDCFLGPMAGPADGSGNVLTFSASACYGDARFAFNLVLSDKRWEIATGGTVKEFDGPPAWRIEDTFFEPFISLDAAIRYVTQTRNKIADPVLKRNAGKTLSILKYYKQGKPLPDELSSGASGGCG